MLKNLPFRARKSKVRGSFSIFKYFQIVIFSIKFPQYVCSVFFLAFFMGPENSKSLKYWANDEPGFMTGLFYSIMILLKN